MSAADAAAAGRVAYVDPVSGASGDMLLGALLDAGLPLAALRAALAPLAGALGGDWSIDAEVVERGGFAATRARVSVPPDPPPRTLADIEALLAAAPLHPADRERATAVFALLGAAEAAVHGAGAAGGTGAAGGKGGADSAPDPATLHLHEVGAADAILDIVGVVAGLRLLGVSALGVGPLPLGGGTVRAAHGILPVPAPAVLEILRRSGLPAAAAHPAEPQAELVTPTGAALLAALAAPGRPAMRVERVGVGAGGRDPAGWPNVLRLWVGRPLPPASSAAAAPEGHSAEAHDATGAPAPVVRPLLVLATDIDDLPPEQVPALIDRLRAAGAVDAWWAPVGMKKGRPGVEVTAVAPPAAEAAVAHAMLRHSSTLGVRVTEVRRWEAARRLVRFPSTLGEAVVKVRRLPGAPPLVAPEYEVARALAERHDLPLAEVYRRLVAEAAAFLDRSDGAPADG